MAWGQRKQQEVWRLMDRGLSSRSAWILWGCVPSDRQNTYHGLRIEFTWGSSSRSHVSASGFPLDLEFSKSRHHQNLLKSWWVGVLLTPTPETLIQKNPGGAWGSAFLTSSWVMLTDTIKLQAMLWDKALDHGAIRPCSESSRYLYCIWNHLYC